MSAVSRWVLKDLETSETYVLPRNPKEMASPTMPHRTTANAGHRRTGFRQGRIPTSWTFRGKVTTKAEYEALQSWAGRDRVEIIDHRLRVHEIIPVGFEPTPRRSGLHQLAWCFDYTFRALYVRRVA